MFELRCFVDDKKLAIVLRALDGLVYEPKVVPVRNAQQKNGKIKSTIEEEGDPGTRMYAALKDEAIYGIVTTTQIKQKTKAIGCKPSSYSYIINQMKSQHLIRNTRQKGQYKLMEAK